MTNERTIHGVTIRETSVRDLQSVMVKSQDDNNEVKHLFLSVSH